MSAVLEEPVICGQPIRGRKHICAFFDSREQQYEILLPFLKQGLRAGDKLLSIVDPDNLADHRRRCTKAGIDLAAADRAGRLGLFTFEDTYLKDGVFSADRMVGLIEKTLSEARAAGFESVRGFGEMHWALTGLPGTEELVEYEARVNEVFARYNDPLVCFYDVNRFPGRVLMDIMCTHPKIILNGIIHENQYYIPPDQFLAAYRKRRATSCRP